MFRLLSRVFTFNVHFELSKLGVVNVRFSKGYSPKSGTTSSPFLAEIVGMLRLEIVKNSITKYIFNLLFDSAFMVQP